MEEKREGKGRRGEKCGGGGGEGAHRLEDEHAIVRAQQLSDQQLEELLLHAASIDAVLPDEVDPQGLEHVPGLLPGYLIQSILHHLNQCHSPCQLYTSASLTRSVMDKAGRQLLYRFCLLFI